MDKRIRKYIFAERIIQASSSIENIKLLTEPCDMQIGLIEKDYVSVLGKSFIILDYGKEINGSIKILTHCLDGGECNIRIRLGESVNEVNAELGYKGATNDHTLRDITTKLVNFSDMDFCQTGFRFARIDFLDDKKIRLKNIIAISIMRDLHPEGSFECNDEQVNKIFDVAKYTLMLNMQTYIWDGIKRDRLVWVGDMHPETMAIGYLFGSDESVEKSMEFSKNQANLPTFINLMPAYSLWWIIITYDYYFKANNFEYLTKQGDYIKGIVELFNGLIENDGKFKFELFFDWPTHETIDEEAGVYGICFLAIKKAKEILKLLNYDFTVCDEILNKLKQKEVKVSWAKQSMAFLVYAELIDASYAHDFLVNGGAKGLSTFMSFYILSAIADSGDFSSALNIMKQYYGGMLEMGATTFWEDFDIDWMKNSCRIDEIVKSNQRDIHGDFGKFCYSGFRHSLCHGWSCGPISYLINRVAGFKTLEAGNKKVEINPNLAGLDWVKASMPTPYGLISMYATKDEQGQTLVSYTAPKEVEIVTTYKNNIYTKS